MYYDQNIITGIFSLKIIDFFFLIRTHYLLLHIINFVFIIISEFQN